MVPHQFWHSWIPKRRWYFNHFHFFLFVSISLLLLIGVRLVNIFFWISSTFAVVLLCLAILYYSLYFIKYKKIVDSYTPNEYYFKIFSFWGIIFFNILFVCCFSFIGFIANEQFENSFFQGESYLEATLLMFQSVIDGGTFGFLDSFDLSCELLLDTCKFASGYFSNTYKYSVNLVVDLAFWSSVTAELAGWLEAKHEVNKLLRSDKIEPQSLRQEEIKRNQVILQRISEGKIDITQYEHQLVSLLKDSNTKETRDVFLSIMQSTKDKLVFKSCLNYFKKNNLTDNRRFKKVCKRIKQRDKLKLIEEFEFWQVKKNL